MNLLAGWLACWLACWLAGAMQRLLSSEGDGEMDADALAAARGAAGVVDAAEQWPAHMLFMEMLKGGTMGTDGVADADWAYWAGFVMDGPLV